MSNFKLFGRNTLTKEQRRFLKSCVEGTWSINTETGLVDVHGSVVIPSIGLEKLPLSFGTVFENFYCYHNKLTTLKGCPHTVNGEFRCNNNFLKSLVGAPSRVGDDMYIWDNPLESLEGYPNDIGGYLFFSLYDISKSHYDSIIPQLEIIMKRGQRFFLSRQYYQRNIDAWHNEKMIMMLNE